MSMRCYKLRRLRWSFCSVKSASHPQDVNKGKQVPTSWSRRTRAGALTADPLWHRGGERPTNPRWENVAGWWCRVVCGRWVKGVKERRESEGGAGKGARPKTKWCEELGWSDLPNLKPFRPYMDIDRISYTINRTHAEAMPTRISLRKGCGRCLIANLLKL